MAAKKTSDGGGGAKGGAKADWAGKGKPKIRTSHAKAAESPAKRTRKSTAGPPAPKAPKRRADSKPAATPRSRSLTPKGPRAKTQTGLGVRPKRARAGVTPPQESLAGDEARGIAVTIAEAAIEKKAVGIEILDVAGKVDYTDFLVIMTGRSDRHVAALAEEIEVALKKRKNRRAISIEGLPRASWVLMDFGDVVVHVFQEDARGVYDIEGLWMDARRIPIASDEVH